jgi:hypothetical protein
MEFTPNLKRRLVLAGSLLVFLSTLGAQDVRVRASPDILLPVGDTDVFGLGFGGSFSADVDVFAGLAPYVGADVHFVAPAASNLDASLMLTTGGLGLGYFAFPLPRLKLGFSAGTGIYVGSYSSGIDTYTTGNVFWRAGAEAGYRFSPSFTLSGAASYVDLMTKTDSFYKGIGVSVLADIGFASKNAEGRVVLQSADSAPLFPILAADYARDSFGAVVIRNAESAEIRNIEVWFSSQGYSSGPVLCAKVPYLPKGGTAEVPLLAELSDQVMTVTENVRVRGELTVKYEMLGQARSAGAETTISILNRNSLTWADPKILAAFVSPNDPSVLDVSKFVAGLVRSKARAELDSNLQYAVGIYEGLRLSGISWAADPQSPYSRSRQTPDEVDYVQYPYQTIAYRGGDSDAIAVLYAAELESVGVPAALIPLPDEVLVAFKLSSDETAVRRKFLEAGDFIFIDGEAWIPVSGTVLREGFLRAWTKGAALVRASPDNRDQFFRLSDAWRRYAPAGVPDIAAAAKKPSADQLQAAFDNTIGLVVAKEVGPRAEQMRSGFGLGGGTGAQRNRLGILYAQYGMYNEALEEFKASAALDYPKAAINIGNVAFLTGAYDTAAAWFEKSLASSPNDASALIGLARSLYELDRFDEADVYFRRAANQVPEVGERYSYLSARITGTAARASAVMDRGGGMLWDE